MSAKRVPCVVVISTVLTSSCVMKPVQVKHAEITDRWAILQTGIPGENYVLVKNSRDLEPTLRRMGCKKNKPCSIGRLGELFVVSQTNAR